MTPAAFAKELAAVLAASLPDGFTATAEDESITIDPPDGLGSTTALNIDPEEADDLDVYADAAEGVLSLAQDVVSETTGTPWPPTTGPNLDLAMPGARADGGVVHLWYGDEDAPMLHVGEIRLAE